MAGWIICFTDMVADHLGLSLSMSAILSQLKYQIYNAVPKPHKSLESEEHHHWTPAFPFCVILLYPAFHPTGGTPVHPN